MKKTASILILVFAFAFTTQAQRKGQGPKFTTEQHAALAVKKITLALDLSEKQNFKVMHVGRNDYSTVHQNFVSYEPTWNIEEYYKQCDVVSGIFLGRTSIEGLLCNKKVLQFDVTKEGSINKVYWLNDDNLMKFDRLHVADQFINLL